MTYQNDPDRGRNSTSHGRRADGSFNWLPLAIGAAIVVALVMMFMPTRDTTGPRTTDTAPRVDRPTTPPTIPPANKPVAPTDPAPTTPK